MLTPDEAEELPGEAPAERPRRVDPDEDERERWPVPIGDGGW